MSRVKRSVTSRNRHKKILKQARGYYGARSRTFKVAKQAVIKANQYSYRDRRNKKRTMRRLWIININALVRKYGYSYSRFIFLLKKLNININRKIFYDMCVEDKPYVDQIFKKISELNEI